MSLPVTVLIASGAAALTATVIASEEAGIIGARLLDPIDELTISKRALSGDQAGSGDLRKVRNT